MTAAEEAKQEHIQQAGSYIAFLRDASEKIKAKDVRENLQKLIRSLEDLRDTEYVFESGEKELNKVYGRYLPYLKMILQDYMRMQEAGSYAALQSVSVKMCGILNTFTDTLNQVRLLLPQDEIDEANAEAFAQQAKALLDEKTGRNHH